jgi:hypothetical protein
VLILSDAAVDGSGRRHPCRAPGATTTLDAFNAARNACAAFAATPPGRTAGPNRRTEEAQLEQLAQLGIASPVPGTGGMPRIAVK